MQSVMRFNFWLAFLSRTAIYSVLQEPSLSWFS